MVLIDKIKAIADAIRNKTGSTGLMTLDEMAECIEYLESDDGTQTYILIDEDGYEIPASLVEEEVELTATANDIRIGTTAVTDSGVIEGEKEIPAYHTLEGYTVVTAGSPVRILATKNYDYTKLQALVCAFNSSITNSVATEKVCVNDAVYLVNSTDAISEVTIDSINRNIDLGITNDSGKPQILRYFMYKEIY